tara:strand:+ start:32489 stop:33616 length:1128 start_codon:yes stop_codon:yes gene_type:complete
MNTPHKLLTLLTAATFLATANSYAILGILKDDKMQEVPDSAELAKQEAAALKAYESAQKAQSDGKLGRAKDIYEDVVEDYPLTSFAPKAQFEIGAIYEKEGREDRAFDSYQDLINRYTGSDLFGEAVRRQFEITNRSMNTKTSRVIGLIPSKAQPSRVIEMFRQIADNAPYSKYAPLAIYQIGVINRKIGKEPESILAFEEVVESYPDDPKAKEASLQIIEVRGDRDTRDGRQLERYQDEVAVFIENNEEDPRSEELRAELGKLQDREAEKKFNIGRYYEKKGNMRAAAIYYQDVLSGTPVYGAAQDRLKVLSAQDPNVVLPPRATKQKVVAPSNVKDRPDYYGPPPPKPPKLEAAPKPQMRVPEDDVLPIPSAS